MTDTTEHVLLLGASPKPQRYAFQALQLLREYGHRVTPVHPRLAEVDGVPVIDHPTKAEQPVDTLTLYLGPARLEPMIDDLLAVRPGRVIFNPGTESAAFQQALDRAGIPWVEDCTLLMLRGGRF